MGRFTSQFLVFQLIAFSSKCMGDFVLIVVQTVYVKIFFGKIFSNRVHSPRSPHHQLTYPAVKNILLKSRFVFSYLSVLI